MFHSATKKPPAPEVTVPCNCCVCEKEIKTHRDLYVGDPAKGIVRKSGNAYCRDCWERGVYLEVHHGSVGEPIKKAG